MFRPDVGQGAIFEAARILDGFREKLAGQEHLTFNPGLIVGGTDEQFSAGAASGSAFGKDNVVAATVVVSGDLRTLSKEQLEQARKTMQGVVADAMPHTEATLAFEDGYPSMAPSAGNARLLEVYSRVSEMSKLGSVAAVSPDRAGAADVSFVAGDAAIVLDGVGLDGPRRSHGPRRRPTSTTLPTQTKRAAMSLRLPGAGRGDREVVHGARSPTTSSRPSATRRWSASTGSRTACPATVVWPSSRRSIPATRSRTAWP